MEKEVVDLYEDTLGKMQGILKNIRKVPVPYTQNTFKNLKINLAKKIRQLKPGVLEEHIQNKNRKEESARNGGTSKKDCCD